LRLRKIVVERVTFVKFRVDNRGSDGTGCFRIKVRTDTAELMISFTSDSRDLNSFGCFNRLDVIVSFTFLLIAKLSYGTIGDKNQTIKQRWG